MIKEINNVLPAEDRPLRASDLQDLWNGFNLFAWTQGLYSTQPVILSGFLITGSNTWSAGLIGYQGKMYYYAGDASDLLTTESTGYLRVIDSDDVRIFGNSTSQVFSKLNVCTGASGGINIGTMSQANVTAWKANAIGLASIGTQHLADLSVTNAKLATSSVSNNKIGAGEIGVGKFAANAIRTKDIANGQITMDKLADDSVGSQQIANLSVSTDNLAPNSVTYDKMYIGSAGRYRPVGFFLTCNSAGSTVVVTRQQPYVASISSGITFTQASNVTTITINATLLPRYLNLMTSFRYFQNLTTTGPFYIQSVYTSVAGTLTLQPRDYATNSPVSGTYYIAIVLWFDTV